VLLFMAPKPYYKNTLSPYTTLFRSPSEDSDALSQLAALSIGSLLDVNLGSGAHPLVEFDLAEGTNSVEFDFEVGALLGAEVLGNFTLIVERLEDGQWIRPDDLGNQFENGVLGLSLLGLGGASGTVSLEDLPEGEYRATLVKNPGLSLAVGATRELNVTATDMLGEANADPLEGNFIDQSASGDL